MGQSNDVTASVRSLSFVGATSMVGMGLVDLSTNVCVAWLPDRLTVPYYVCLALDVHGQLS